MKTYPAIAGFFATNISFITVQEPSRPYNIDI